MLNNIGIKQPKDRLHATEKCSYEATNHKILRHDVRLLTSKGGGKYGARGLVSSGSA